MGHCPFLQPSSLKVVHTHSLHVLVLHSHCGPCHPQRDMPPGAAHGLHGSIQRALLISGLSRLAAASATVGNSLPVPILPWILGNTPLLIMLRIPSQIPLLLSNARLVPSGCSGCLSPTLSTPGDAQIMPRLEASAQTFLACWTRHVQLPPCYLLSPLMPQIQHIPNESYHSCVFSPCISSCSQAQGMLLFQGSEPETGSPLICYCLQLPHILALCNAHNHPGRWCYYDTLFRDRESEIQRDEIIYPRSWS